MMAQECVFIGYQPPSGEFIYTYKVSDFCGNF